MGQDCTQRAYNQQGDMMPQVTTTSRHVDHDVLRDMAERLLIGAGVLQVHAALVADSLVESNLRGIDSHGIARLPHYLARITAGSVDPAATPTFELISPSLGMVDAHHALGQIAMWEAATQVVSLAENSGTAWVAVKNSSHCGALAYYGQAIARRGMVAVVLTHSDAMVAPYAGAEPFCGTNPLCIVIPGERDEHMCLDMATSCVPWNTVMNAAIEGVSIPDDWALDAQGNATTDPTKVAAVRPTGQYKGSGLGLIIDLLCALPGGGPLGPDISSMYGELDRQRLLGGLVGAIDLQRFVGLDVMVSRTAQIQARWNDVKRENPQEPVLWPGQPELQRRHERLANGIPVGVETLSCLRGLMQAAGLTVSSQIG